MKALVLVGLVWTAVSLIAALLVVVAPWLPGVPEEDEREP